MINNGTVIIEGIEFEKVQEIARNMQEFIAGKRGKKSFLVTDQNIIFDFKKNEGSSVDNAFVVKGKIEDLKELDAESGRLCKIKDYEGIATGKIEIGDNIVFEGGKEMIENNIKNEYGKIYDYEEIAERIGTEILKNGILLAEQKIKIDLLENLSKYTMSKGEKDSLALCKKLDSVIMRNGIVGASNMYAAATTEIEKLEELEGIAIYFSRETLKLCKAVKNQDQTTSDINVKVYCDKFDKNCISYVFEVGDYSLICLNAATNAVAKIDKFHNKEVEGEPSQINLKKVEKFLKDERQLNKEANEVLGKKGDRLFFTHKGDQVELRTSYHLKVLDAKDNQAFDGVRKMYDKNLYRKFISTLTNVKDIEIYENTQKDGRLYINYKYSDQDIYTQLLPMISK